MSATKIHTHTGRRAKIILLYILIFKAGWLKTALLFLGKARGLCLPKISGQALGPNHCPIKHVQVVKQPGAKLTI
jgi:hypothetical protein